MVCQRSAAQPAPDAVQKWHRRRQKVALAAIFAATLVVCQYTAFISPTPQHTSLQTGQAWVNELLRGHTVRFYNMFGMQKSIFRRLYRELGALAGLGPTRYVSAAEQLAIFLRMARTGASNRKMQERFQRSGDTISKVFHRILGYLTSPAFYNRYVKLPPENTTPPEIRSNPKFFPFFANCLGAIDGSHIDAHVDSSQAAAYRDRKGRLSTNILAACTFDLRFSYLLVGWKGSATDSRIFKDAREKGFAVPPGKFYLADAGFPSCDTLLVPYRGVRYHLKEWGRAPEKPHNYKELYNLRL
ncbi:putative nuclease activity [Lyophyllum shimeji]|uniref:Nuclease activity n=1 Tax=Lyophyllum shimeji TaxID=47721 RepID=A0A9P3PYH0_LYOSH|nr:putative nuclease activity [Lyophyllum shimeji]